MSPNEELSPSVEVLTWNRFLEEPAVTEPFGSDFDVIDDERGKSGIQVKSILHVNENRIREKILSLRINPRLDDVYVRDYYFNPSLGREISLDDSSGNSGSPESSPAPFLESGERSEIGEDSTESEGEEESGHEMESAKKGRTRINVPSDVIKLEDRLHYILAPPLENLLKSESLELPFPPFGYQKQGIAFLYSSHFAILADEMGLGKTMQAITTIRLLLKSRECRRILLVCPKPLIFNWKREFELWAPEIAVELIEGKSSRREWVWRMNDAPVRIANYELLIRDRKFFDNPEMARYPYDLVVLDESQRIKNRHNATFEAVSAIPRRRNWALTGTPIENSAEDLVSIFEFLAPGFLESGLKPRQMSEVAGEHILRRTKKNVLKDLPPKLIRDARIELEGEQWESYRIAEEEGVIRLNELGDSVTLRHAFELILRLKQICNFDPATGESAKLERLLADLDEVTQSGHKVIVFSQWVETLLRLKSELKAYHPAEYHGRISHAEREKMIDRFRNDDDCHVILMSYGAGSVGLNLQFAEYVFLFDRWWNPAVEDQAINRAHRIGAAGPVTVTRFLCLGTIEEKIDQILTEKRKLADLILSGARGFDANIKLSQEEIFSLFNLKVTKNKK